MGPKRKEKTKEVYVEVPAQMLPWKMGLLLLWNLRRIQDIVLFCDSKFGITFPIFDKIEVNGPNESPLYTFLKSQKGFQGFDEENSMTEGLKQMLSAQGPDYESKSDIKWNFTKFLIDQQGNVVERYEPTADFWR